MKKKYTMILQQNDYVLEQEVENIISFVKEKRASRNNLFRWKFHRFR